MADEDVVADPTPATELDASTVAAAVAEAPPEVVRRVDAVLKAADAEQPPMLSSSDLAAAYEKLPETDQRRLSEQVTAMANRVDRLAQRRAEREQRGIV